MVDETIIHFSVLIAFVDPSYILQLIQKQLFSKVKSKLAENTAS